MNKDRMSVAECAILMNVSEQFVRVGLQKGKLPFGYALQISANRFTYWISAKLFAQTTGITRRLW